MTKLPPKVHQRGPSLYYVHRGKWHRLCRADDPEHVLHGELWKHLRKGHETLGDVMDAYKVKRLPGLALTTQTDYTRIIDNVLRPWCGHMHPDDLTLQDVAAYLEMRLEAGRGAIGNKEMAVLSSIYDYGLRIRACVGNPCRGVRRNKERERTCYVDDESFRTALRAARPGLRHLLWAAYLTGFRQQDLRNLTKDDIMPDGIRVRQSKDGKHELRLWTESLRKLVRRALERSKCRYVFTNEHGQHWSREAVKSAMRRLKDNTGATWHFHDVRAKADSDHETGFGLMRRYNRARRLKAVR